MSNQSETNIKIRATPISSKKTNKSSLIRDRAHVVLLKNNGFTIEHTAQAVLRSKDFVKQTIRRHKQGKLEQTELSSHNYKLSEEERKAVIKMIQKECPKDVKEFNFTTQSWATDILRTVVKRCCAK